MPKESISITEQARIQQMHFGAKDPFPILTGRQIWNQLSITGLNRSPVNILSAFITTDFEADIKNPEHADPIMEDQPAISVIEMTEYLLVDGSFVIMELPKPNEDGDKWVILKNVFQPIRVNKFVQGIEDKKTGDLIDTSIMVRLFSRKDVKANWLVQDIRNPQKKDETVMSTKTLPNEAVFPWVNKVHPSGLLVPNQNTYQRIEEIEEQIRVQTGPASLALIVTGYLGDIEQARETFSRGARIIFVPGQATITRVASNNVADQLTTRSDKLITLYFKNTNVATVEDTSNISGVSRKILMTPQISEVNRQRAMIKQIYSHWDIEVSFGGVELLTPEEKSKELDVLKRGRDEGILTEPQWKKRSGALFGV